MPENQKNQDLAKAKAFFERARKVADTNNFDYAIEMYLEGIGCAPDALEEGHIALHKLALWRQGKGGKKPTMMEKVKLLRGKTPLEKMLNAEHLFAKDPDSVSYAEAILKAAAAGGYTKTAKWIADLVFQANNASAKPSFSTYILLKDSYATIGEYDRAIAACQYAVKLKPTDGDLADEFKRLSAELTVARGKYDSNGDFRESIKDRETQEKLYSQERVVKTESYQASAVKEARAAMAQDPELPKNIYNLVNALVGLQTEEGENEAIELLEKTYVAKKDFSFKKQAGEIKAQQLRRKIRKGKEKLESGGDGGVKAELVKLSSELNKVELEHYRLCVDNYPTDLALKYEYAVRLIRDKKYDDAIPLLQEAQRNPRRKLAAMDKIGYCFFKKGWFADAVDVFNQALDQHELKDDSMGKELRYNLARAYEEQKYLDKAMEIYRKIAQLDFGYKDVRDRINNLRNMKSDSE